MKSALRVPALLSAVGGFLDSFVWILHGNVFANAQTGNIVLMGVSAAQGNWPQALRQLAPAVAFFFGVFAAQWLRNQRPSQGLFSAAMLSLYIEVAILIVVGLLPSWFPNPPIIIIIAFVTALQSSSFDHVEKWSYNSVVTTGNLRSTIKSFYSGVFPLHDANALRETQVFATVCASFALGAFVGAALTMRFEAIALAFPITLLLLTLLFCFQEMQVTPGAARPPSGDPTQT